MNFKVGDKVWIYDAFEPYEGEAVVTILDVDRIGYRRENGPSSYIDTRPKSHDTIRHFTDHDPKCFGWPGCDGCSDTERPAIVPPAPEFKVGDVVRLSDAQSPLNGCGGVVIDVGHFISVDFGEGCAGLNEYARDYLCDPEELTLLPPAPVMTEAQRRKAQPIARGVLDYFPDALLAVAEVSRIGNEQHNKGQPMHWAFDKSNDHADSAVRHLTDRGTVDSDGGLHSAKAVWRSLANLQTELEAKDPELHARRQAQRDAAARGER